MCCEFFGTRLKINPFLAKIIFGDIISRIEFTFLYILFIDSLNSIEHQDSDKTQEKEGTQSYEKKMPGDVCKDNEQCRDLAGVSDDILQSRKYTYS